MHPRYNSAGRRRQAARPAKRSAVEFWTRIRDEINREHRVLAGIDPRSPHIRPTLAIVGGAR